MNTPVRHLPLLAALLLAAVAFGCGQKEIVCPAGGQLRLSVAFEWDKAPGARVEGMTLYFFPEDDGGKIWRFDIAGSEGGAVDIPAGNYRMIAVNNDLPGVTFSGAGTFAAFSANAVPAGGDSLLIPTGTLYSAVVDHIAFTPCGVTYSKPDGCSKECPAGLVRCSPDTASVVYNVYIRSVDGLERLKSAVASINGVASSLTLCDDATGSGSGAIVLRLAAASGFPLAGSTSGFDTANAPVTLTLTVVRTDGKAFTKKFNISRHALNHGTAHHVDIYIDEMDIPDYSDSPGDDGDDVDMSVIVDGWNVIEIDL